ncbi:hypothetical protein [Pedobacter sp. PACM 27299]|nr:hypothetical protein [Pedobacter sp. PACM 27299]
MPIMIFKGQPSESVLETQVELSLMSKCEQVVHPGSCNDWFVIKSTFG